jgi:hypothetical protein
VLEDANMRALAQGLLMTVMTFASLAGDAVGTAGVSSDDARAVRSVVEAQLKALAADDAALAFSYASPSIRMQFGNASNFITMVRQGYPMLIRPAATEFFRPEAVEDGVMQLVHLRDQDGRSWLATYQMQRQPDRSWRINGCVVESGDRESSI